MPRRWPRVDAKLSANRVDVNPQSLGVQNLPIATPFNLYLASVGVSYTFDLFGATRSELQALQAEIDYQRYEVEAARLMLAGNVVTAAIREAQLREQIVGSEEIIALQSRQLEITERLQQLWHRGADRCRGAAPRTRADTRRTARAAASARRVRHRLAVYTGQPPGSRACLSSAWRTCNCRPSCR